jgi:hypothetical protein
MIYIYKQKPSKVFDKGRMEKSPFFPDLSDKKKIEKSFPFKKNKRFSPIFEIKERFF